MTNGPCFIQGTRSGIFVKINKSRMNSALVKGGGGKDVIQRMTLQNLTKMKVLFTVSQLLK
jgi:hypothetical protein